MKTLQELWNEAGQKPFKAKKVLSTDNVFTKVGDTIQIIEEFGDFFEGIRFGRSDEERISLLKSSHTEKVWKKI